MSTIDDERAAFIRDLLRVLTSLYSWAGAVVHGQTEDGHDVIELCDGTRVWTEAMLDYRPAHPGWVIALTNGDRFEPWKHYREVTCRRAVNGLIEDIADHRIRDLLTGPPEDA